MKHRTDIARYVEEITGASPVVRDVPLGDADRVPLFLRAAYQLSTVELFTRRLVLAAEHEAGGTTPAEYARHVELLRAALGADVALVLPDVPAHVRNRLVRYRVPFIVPGRQMFLPPLAVDLRERGARRVRQPRAGLSAAAQALVLFHLLVDSVEGRPLREVASALGYSAMTLSNVADELQSAGLCEIVTAGRTRHLVFGTRGRELWERALPLLDSPVRARHCVRHTSRQAAELPVAGITALERYTGIVDDPVLTVAVRDREYRTLLERGDLVGCDGPEEAEAAVEVWPYDPVRLASTGCVDRLSLYLSLRDSPDERVQKELKSLLEGVPW
jgi:DNA-binding MarR family transcriptional regulator